MLVGRCFGGVHHLTTDQPVRRNGDDTLPQFLGVGAVITDRQLDDFYVGRDDRRALSNADILGGKGEEVPSRFVRPRSSTPPGTLSRGSSWDLLISLFLCLRWDHGRDRKSQ